MTDPALGIDLGTTYSLAAIADATGVHVVENAEGERLTPSAVHVASSGTLTVGVHARRLGEIEPENTMAFFKRDMGTDAV